MAARPLALLALLIAFAAGSAAPALAHDPDHHDSQLLSLGQTGLASSVSPLLTSSYRCEDGMAALYPCERIDLESFVSLPELGGATGNDIWGWTDPKTKREYAIMGTSTSTGFVDVTDPKDPDVIGILPTRGIPDYVLWRDVKVDGHYAFIVSEVTASGLQVFDLHRLRDAGGGALPTIFNSDAAYDEFSFAHNIGVNPRTDYAYVVGSDTCDRNEEAGGLHMVDISNPLEPEFAGCAYVDEFAETAEGEEPEPNNYVHDVECVIYRGPDARYRGREICFGSNENTVAIYDVTNKTNPKVLSTTTYPTDAYTHQGWLTRDQRYFLFGDEIDEQEHGLNTTTYIMNVSDLDKPPTPKAFAHDTASVDHNLYIHGKYVYESNYLAGLRILKFNKRMLRAGRLKEVAYFDVWPFLDVAETQGAWSNYRFPGSGTTVVSVIENHISGMFVLKPRLR